MSEHQDPEVAAALAAAFNTTTPYDQVRTGTAFEAGQYDFTILALQPEADKNGLYMIRMEAKCDAPHEIAALPGKASVLVRSIYIGSKVDKMATQPDTRLNNVGLGFLKKIAEANKLPANAQTDAQMCAQLVGKRFGIALIETEYTRDGKTNKGIDFGKTVTPAGTIPAKLNRVAAGANGAATPAAAPAQGASFA